MCLFFVCVCFCFSQGAGVETVWVDHISPGDIDGWSMCWTREGGQEYCVDTSDDVSAEHAEGERDAKPPFLGPGLRLACAGFAWCRGGLVLVLRRWFI